MLCPTIFALLVRPLTPHNSLRENESAYDRYMIRPRVLLDISKLDTSTSIVGCKVKFPFGFSPTAMQTLAHPDGEEGTSKACAKNNTLMGLSNYSTKELEKVIAHSTGNPYVMQMSLLKNKKAMIQMIKRAEGNALISDSAEWLCPFTNFNLSCRLQGTIPHP